jgi:hypothetical protein
MLAMSLHLPLSMLLFARDVEMLMFVGVSDPRGSSTDLCICCCVSLPRWVDARWNTSGGNEAYIILHRGARSRGYKSRERVRARAREKERESLRASVSTCLVCPASLHSPYVNVCQRPRLRVNVYVP